jgi:hypothetical protein
MNSGRKKSENDHILVANHWNFVLKKWQTGMTSERKNVRKLPYFVANHWNFILKNDTRVWSLKEKMYENDHILSRSNEISSWKTDKRVWLLWKNVRKWQSFVANHWNFMLKMTNGYEVWRKYEFWVKKCTKEKMYENDNALSQIVEISYRKKIRNEYEFW